MLAPVVLAASLGLTPVYLSSGEPVGKSSLGAALELGFPWTSLWATYGVNDRVDVGLRLGTIDFQTEAVDLLVRGELWRRERLRLSGKIWGGWTKANDPFSAQLLADEGPWGLGALLTVSGHADEGGLGLYVSIGGRVAFYPFVLCYSCGNAPEVVSGKGSAWSALGMVGLELPVYSTFALHVELGAELRFNFPDSSIPVVPIPVIDGGLTWHW